jgi:hypothetical protein
MALKPKFESQEDSSTSTDTGSVVAEQPTTHSPDATTFGESSTAIAKAGSTAVGAARKFVNALLEYENIIPVEDVADLGVGTFPKITADLSGLVMDKNNELGSAIKIELISWNRRWVVTTGVDNAEAKELVKFSLDGVYLQGDNRTCKDYVAFLRDVEGYKDAAIKEYYSVWGNLTHTKGQDIDPAEQQMVELQLSPQSVAQFKRYQLETGLKVSRGTAVESPMIEVVGNKRDQGGHRYGFMTFKSA